MLPAITPTPPFPIQIDVVDFYLGSMPLPVFLFDPAVVDLLFLVSTHHLSLNYIPLEVDDPGHLTAAHSVVALKGLDAIRPLLHIVG